MRENLKKNVFKIIFCALWIDMRMACTGISNSKFIYEE